MESSCPSDGGSDDVHIAFVCETTDPHTGRHKSRLHAFGRSTLASGESYNSRVVCDACFAPDGGNLKELSIAWGSPKTQLPSDGYNSALPAAEPARSLLLHRLTTTAATKSSVSFAGPGNCVAAYKSVTDTCVLETRCRSYEQDLNDFDYGLTCVDEDGETARHLYGRNSFEPEERFDTRLSCSLCLALDTRTHGESTSSHSTTGKSVEEAIADLKKLIGGAMDQMSKLETEVSSLKNKAQQQKKVEKVSEKAPSTASPAQNTTNTTAAFVAQHERLPRRSHHRLPHPRFRGREMEDGEEDDDEEAE